LFFREYFEPSARIDYIRFEASSCSRYISFHFIPFGPRRIDPGKRGRWSRMASGPIRRFEGSSTRAEFQDIREFSWDDSGLIFGRDCDRFSFHRPLHQIRSTQYRMSMILSIDISLSRRMRACNHICARLRALIRSVAHSLVCYGYNLPHRRKPGPKEKEVLCL